MGAARERWRDKNRKGEPKPAWEESFPEETAPSSLLKGPLGRRTGVYKNQKRVSETEDFVL